MRSIKLIESLYGFLTSDSELTNIVGNRIYPVVAQQNTETPYVVHSIISVDITQTHDKPIASINHKFQFNIFANNQADVHEITYLIKNLLSGKQIQTDFINAKVMQIQDLSINYEEQLELFYTEIILNILTI